MIKKLFALALIAVVWACSEKMDVDNIVVEVPDISAINGRLVFKSEQKFMDAISELDGTAPEKLLTKLKSLSYKSLGKSLGEKRQAGEELPADLQQYDDYAVAHRTLLNENAIVQVGNDIIKYEDGKKFYQDVALFGHEDITKSDRVGYYTIQISAQKADASGRLFNTSNNTGGAQYDFYYLPDYSMRKFVNEWLTYFETSGMYTYSSCTGGYTNVTTTARLKLRLRLFGKANPNKSWTIAPDPRDLGWNLKIADFNLHYIDTNCTSRTTAVGTRFAISSIHDENSGSYEASVFDYPAGTISMPASAVSGYFTGNATGWAYQAHLHNDHTSVWFSWYDYMN